MDSLSTLRDLEANYKAEVDKFSAALNHVRALIKLEGGGTEKPKLAEVLQTSTIQTTSRYGMPHNFSTFRKGDAVEMLLGKSGPLTAADIFNEMKAAGHAVASRASLVSMLSTDNRFRPEDGKWALSEPRLITADAEHEKPA